MSVLFSLLLWIGANPCYSETLSGRKEEIDRWTRATLNEYTGGDGRRDNHVETCTISGGDREQMMAAEAKESSSLLWVLVYTDMSCFNRTPNIQYQVRKT